MLVKSQGFGTPVSSQYGWIKTLFQEDSGLGWLYSVSHCCLKLLHEYPFIVEPPKVKVKVEVKDTEADDSVEQLPVSDTAHFVQDIAKKVFCV